MCYFKFIFEYNHQKIDQKFKMFLLWICFKIFFLWISFWTCQHSKTVWYLLFYKWFCLCLRYFSVLMIYSTDWLLHFLLYFYHSCQLLNVDSIIIKLHRWRETVIVVVATLINWGNSISGIDTGGKIQLKQCCIRKNINTFWNW